jgi:AAA+ ATPase superfamily predicted ATPase
LSIKTFYDIYIYNAIIINKSIKNVLIYIYKGFLMIGREREQGILSEALVSNRAEMIAVYGRRRIGKTFLIEQFYKQENINMVSMIGQANANMTTQLSNTKNRLIDQKGIDVTTAKSWSDIFYAIQTYHQNFHNPNHHFVLFIDELPWIATVKSGFIGALSYSWNSYFEKFSNVTFVLCGSAASWMVKKVVQEKGGLHQRITRQIPLFPFTLKESEAYLKEQGFIYSSRKEIIDLYIILGGVAQYLRFLNPQKSIAENINQLCFSVGGELQREFDSLFLALFGKKGVHQALVAYMGKSKQQLFDASSLAKKFKVKIEKIYQTLDELEMAGFVSRQNRYGQKKRDVRYILTDFFSKFHLKWMEGISQNELMQNPNYWQYISSSQNWVSWAGYAFEAVCHKHILQIKKVLGISGVQTQSFYWEERGVAMKQGSQIDMLIKRADKTVMIVEIKYYNQPFSISKSYAQNLHNKIESFRASDKEHNSLLLVMLTTYGLKQNQYSNIVSSDITMDSLFDK